MKLYVVGFTDGTEFTFEATSFTHLHSLLEVYCLIRGLEVKSVQLK